MIRSLLKITRFPLVLTALTDSVAGYVLGRPDFCWGAAGLLGAASACLYLAGMALNDVADTARDRTLHPERPIPSGKLGRGAAAVSGFLLLIIGVALTIPLGTDVLLLAGVTASGILLYDFLVKRWDIPGALNMGMIRGLNLWMGFVAAQGFAFSAPPIALTFYIFIVTMISLQEEKKEPLRSFTVLWVLQMAAVIGASWLVYPPHPVGICASLGLAAAILYKGTAVRTADGDRRMAIIAHIRFSILMVIPFDACLLFSAGHLEWGVGLAALLLPSFGMIRLYRHV